MKVGTCKIKREKWILANTCRSIECCFMLFYHTILTQNWTEGKAHLEIQFLPAFFYILLPPWRSLFGPNRKGSSKGQLLNLLRVHTLRFSIGCKIVQCSCIYWCSGADAQKVIQWKMSWGKTEEEYITLGCANMIFSYSATVRAFLLSIFTFEDNSLKDMGTESMDLTSKKVCCCKL